MNNNELLAFVIGAGAALVGIRTFDDHVAKSAEKISEQLEDVIDQIEALDLENKEETRVKEEDGRTDDQA